MLTKGRRPVWVIAATYVILCSQQGGSQILSRRVIVHFRKQEWTAIALDFAIVVVGALIAIQITAWCERRAELEHLDGSLS